MQSQDSFQARDNRHSTIAVILYYPYVTTLQKENKHYIATMALEKGYLNQQKTLRLSTKQIVVGLVLGLLLAVLLFGLATFYFEFFRRKTSLLCQTIYQFTPKERNFYAWFYAATAFILGQNLTFWYWARRCEKIESNSNRLSLHLINIANEQSGISTYIFTFMVRMATFYFLLFGTGYLYPRYYLLDLHQNFSFLFILIPLVLWLSSWTTIFRLFRRNALRFMAISALTIFTSSFLLSQVNLMDDKTWNEEQMKQNLLYQYEVLLPKIEHSQLLSRKSQRIDLTLGYAPSTSTDHPTLIYENTVLPIEEVAHTLASALPTNNLGELHYLTVKISADRRVAMAYINKLKLQIKRAAVFKVAFATRQENIPFENKSLPITHYGILQVLKLSDTQFIKDHPPKQPVFTPCYTCFTNQNHIDLAADARITLNNEPTTLTKLSEILHTTLNENRDYILKYTYHPTHTLDQYLNVHATLKNVIYSLRDQLSMTRYGMPYKNLNTRKEKETIKNAYPMRLYEPQSP